MKNLTTSLGRRKTDIIVEYDCPDQKQFGLVWAFDRWCDKFIGSHGGRHIGAGSGMGRRDIQYNFRTIEAAEIAHKELQKFVHSPKFVELENAGFEEVPNLHF